MLPPSPQLRMEPSYVVILDREGPEPEDPMLLYHVDEVAQSHHQNLLSEADGVHDNLVEVRFMYVGLFSLMA